MCVNRQKRGADSKKPSVTKIRGSKITRLQWNTMQLNRSDAPPTGSTLVGAGIQGGIGILKKQRWECELKGSERFCVAATTSEVHETGEGERRRRLGEAKENGGLKAVCFGDYTRRQCQEKIFLSYEWKARRRLVEGTFPPQNTLPKQFSGKSREREAEFEERPYLEPGRSDERDYPQLFVSTAHSSPFIQYPARRTSALWIERLNTTPHVQLSPQFFAYGDEPLAIHSSLLFSEQILKSEDIKKLKSEMIGNHKQNNMNRFATK
ncbi:hypothetical protein P691DRAFT_785970 [Macrolepiota fuliginosa MF-IS2]|uniref:Uncharacterized protein n=1 Tax=Macrolepiota fuliginosa MF-IS2 TaxID=1400762 RepID=A0A9P5X6C4_9AGAR|nr:hypothetical protein P691DRAFT_785970 [Macrolepiota fuliginosa MF-IS2]